MFLFYKNIIIGLFLHVIYCFNSDVDNDYNTAIINKISNISRRQDAIPIINVRGSHFEVGHMVGKTFGSVIQEFVKSYYPLNDYLNIYKTAEGRKTYQDTLNAVNMYFPQYLVELKGVADGSGVEFHKLFLIHIDDVILPGDSNSVDAGTGCSSVMVDNVYGQFIGHTEDALKETVNHFYILNAHIIPSHEEIGLGGKFKAREERWEAMTYAGSLSGYASGHNYHGLVFSINTIFAKYPHKGKIPRVFLTRALLASNADLTEIENILKNEGVGTADAFNVNVGFLNQNNIGHQKLYSIEVTPSSENNAYSDVNTQEVNKIFFHTNRLLHTKSCEELRDSGWNSSVARESRFDEINCKHQIEKPEDILKLLGDKKNEKWRIFRDDDSDFVNTINLGLFDLMNKTWKLWTNNPTNHSDILIELPLEFLQATEPGECK